MAEADVPGGMAEEGSGGDGEGTDEWIAPEAVEPPEEDEELPPAPAFLVVRNAYGPGAHSVKFADGKPVGVWMREQQMLPEEVEEQLTAMGLDQDLVEFFVLNR